MSPSRETQPTPLSSQEETQMSKCAIDRLVSVVSVMNWPSMAVSYQNQTLTHGQRKTGAESILMQTVCVKSLADCPVISVQSICKCTNTANLHVSQVTSGQGEMVLMGRMEKVANIALVFCCCDDSLSISGFKGLVFHVYPVSGAYFSMKPLQQHYIQVLCMRTVKVLNIDRCIKAMGLLPGT